MKCFEKDTRNPGSRAFDKQYMHASCAHMTCAAEKKSRKAFRVGIWDRLTVGIIN